MWCTCGCGRGDVYGQYMGESIMWNDKRRSSHDSEEWQNQLKSHSWVLVLCTRQPASWNGQINLWNIWLCTPSKYVCTLLTGLPPKMWLELISIHTRSYKTLDTWKVKKRGKIVSYLWRHKNTPPTLTTANNNPQNRTPPWTNTVHLPQTQWNYAPSYTTPQCMQ